MAKLPRDLMMEGYKDGLALRWLSPTYFENLKNETRNVREYMERSLGMLGGVTTITTSIIILGYTIPELLK